MLQNPVKKRRHLDGRVETFNQLPYNIDNNTALLQQAMNKNLDLDRQADIKYKQDYNQYMREIDSIANANRNNPHYGAAFDAAVNSAVYTLTPSQIEYMKKIKRY